MDANEEYVRTRWEEPTVVFAYGAIKIVTPHRIRGSGLVLLASAESETQAWSAAAEYTRQREEEIRQLEEEITVTRNAMLRATNDVWKVIDGKCAILSRDLEGAYAVCAIRHGRVLARLEAALADLKRGWKEQG